MITKITPEFSRLVSILDIEADGIEINILANSLECDALAKRFSVKHVQRLSAKLMLSKPKGKLGVLIPGIGGAVSTTFIAGIELYKKGNGKLF